MLDGWRMATPSPAFSFLVGASAPHTHEQWVLGGRDSPSLGKSLGCCCCPHVPKVILKKYQYLTTSGLRELKFNASVFPPMHLAKNK